jgi:hypothetical protein
VGGRITAGCLAVGGALGLLTAPAAGAARCPTRTSPEAFASAAKLREMNTTTRVYRTSVTLRRTPGQKGG